MTKVPIRWSSAPSLPTKGTSVRPMIARAQSGEIDFSPCAFEVLSAVSGRRLTRPQRAALLPGLLEHLRGPAAPPGDAGPLADADVFGSVLGLAHYALEQSGDWVFVRIPEGPTPSPDIWAAHAASRPWNIELKGVSPLSSDIDVGDTLDTCGARVGPQVRKGRGQLADRVVSRPSGIPGVLVDARAPSPVGKVGGRALAVSILPDVALLGRTDIKSAGKRGCPTSGEGSTKACREQCFVATDVAAATTALWIEPDPAPATTASPPSHGLLPYLHAIVLAGWTGSRFAVDDALGTLVQKLWELDAEMGPEDKLRLLLGALRETRQIGSVARRVEAVEHLIRASGEADAKIGELLRGEAQAGQHVERVHLLLDQIEPESAAADVVVETEDASAWHGRWDGTSLRLAPPVGVLGPLLDAQAIRRVFLEHVFPQLENWAGEPEGSAPEPVRLHRSGFSDGTRGEAGAVTVGLLVGPPWLTDWMVECSVDPSWPSYWSPRWLFLALASNDGRITVYR